MGERASEKIVPFPNDGDPLGGAGNALLSMLQQAAAITEENSKRAPDVAHGLSDRLRAAEDRLRELEADILYYKDRADRADQWTSATSAVPPKTDIPLRCNICR